MSDNLAGPLPPSGRSVDLGTNARPRTTSGRYRRSVDVLSSRLLVRTDDLAASTAWWRDTLGLSVAREYGAEGVATGVAFFCGGVLVEFSGHGSDPAGLALWLQVPDVMVESDRLIQADVAHDGRPERMPWGLIEWWIRSPEGVRLVLVEIPKDHPLRSRRVLE
ncbi:MAG: VOC family protein [Candidatus Microthrix parvicella]|jgi:catechol 2,3-dioxygenase-like lactoylglutathione lyase family enzyme|nr:VOC family protein [Candidatus Microthrix parvicella]